MKSFVPITIACAILTTPAFAQNADDEERWRVQAYSATEVSLYHGAKSNDEVLTIDFSCNAKTQKVSVLIREISEKVKPDTKVCATLGKDGTTSEVCGTAIPNELAGIPDMEATVESSLPLFNATRDEAKSLTITVLGDSFNVPLKGFNAAQHNFGKICFGGSN